MWIVLKNSKKQFKGQHNPKKRTYNRILKNNMGKIKNPHYLKDEFRLV